LIIVKLSSASAVFPECDVNNRMTAGAGCDRIVNVMQRCFRLRPRGPRPFLIPVLVLCLLLGGAGALGDDIDDELGLWSMYFWNANLGDSRWVAQGDLQYRHWSVGSDTEQILLRGALGYRPAGGGTVLAGGFAFIESRPFGDGGRDVNERRVYQEALIPQGPLGRVHLTHRLRFEQRWIDGQDFRTRFRYALFANIPLNREDLGPGATYVALYNEVFVNGQRDIGGGRSVDRLDRNRLYGGIGYTLAPGARLQIGVMRQNAPNFDRNQLQLSFHHSF
jgi:hypothetical protein